MPSGPQGVPLLANDGTRFRRYPIVAEPYLDTRLDTLRRTQNPDGGWGYFPGKHSWIEPTAYAALALHGEPAADRAWALLKSWQASNGSLRPSAEVQLESWATSLFVTLATVRNDVGDPARRAVEWLLDMSGTETNWLSRAVVRIGLVKPDRNPNLKGWPWKPDTSSWVEPTSHAVVALKKVATKYPSEDLRERIRMGQANIMDVQATDGGWNYGNRTVLNVDLPSYPETTGIALVGLQQYPGLEKSPNKSVDAARAWLARDVSPLARAWLRIGLRLHGVEPATSPRAAAPPDLQIVALEALAERNFKLLGTPA